MKNNIICKKLVSILLMILLLYTTRVYATNDSFNTTLVASATQVKREDNVTITIGLRNIQIESGEKGIGAYTAGIKFDSSVLEYVSTDSTDKWEAPFYQNGLIAGNTKDGKVVNTTQNIGTITFKVKKDAKLGETTIQLTDFLGSTAESDVSASNQSIKITILDNNDEENNNNDEENNNNNNNSNNNSNNNNSNNNLNNSNTSNNVNSSNTYNNVIDNSSKQGTLPKTGEQNTIIFVGIGICGVLAIIFIVRIRIINKKAKLL